MLYELRTYTACPGKLPNVVARFRDFTAAKFTEYGFRIIGFWTPQVGGSSHELIYMLGWESYEERNRCFAAFRGDPERARVFAESEKDGPIVADVQNVMLAPTDFSPLN